MNKIIPILTSNSKISIRVLDWFVTNYSKKYNIIYKVNHNDVIEHFNVFLQYKLQLKGYRKKLFDPFCRKKRIAFYYDENKCIITTIGQLNFFRWSIKYKILDYVYDNLTNICNDMNESTKKYIINFKNKNKNLSDNVTNITDQSDDAYDYYYSLDNSDNSDKSDDTIIISNGLNKTKNDISKIITDKKIKKRHELSENKNKTINKINMDITINFD